jgi:hypothetical protein
MTDSHNYSPDTGTELARGAAFTISSRFGVRLRASLGPQQCSPTGTVLHFYAPDETSIRAHPSVRLKSGSALSKTLRASERRH